MPLGTPSPAGFSDVQARIRDIKLAPGWTPAGTDVVGQRRATFNDHVLAGRPDGPRDHYPDDLGPDRGPRVRCAQARRRGRTYLHPTAPGKTRRLRLGREHAWCSRQFSDPFFGRHRMFRSSWHPFAKRTLPASQQAGRPTRSTRLRCEELELRLQPSAFAFSTGVPDGRIATITEPANAHNSQVEYESGDDFVLTSQTKIGHASFTGLLTGGATPHDVKNVVVEIYRVFPHDSNVGRTSGPPIFSTSQVPTRVNSPSDVAFKSRDSGHKQLSYRSHVLSPSFAALASVSSAAAISVKSGGNGAVTGEEVEFDVTFKNRPLNLPAGHYFFVPQVGLSHKAPAGAHFLWLSAPRPIVPPGTPFPAGNTDLQSWMRDDPPLAPDWLRIGADIIGGTTFNATFELSGHTVAHHSGPGSSDQGRVGMLA